MYKVISLVILSFFISKQNPDEWTVSSFNIRYDNSNDPLLWEDRKTEVINAVCYFDIVGFQEVLPNQLEDLKTGIPWMNYYSMGRDEDGGGEACPIFWQKDKYDLLHSETRWLSDSWSEEGSIGWDAHLPRIATIVLLYQRSSGKTIKVINSHWSHVSSEAREGSAALISGWALTGKADAVVVLGDFNAEPDTPEIQTLIESGLIDTYYHSEIRCRRGYGTYTTFDPDTKGSSRIDYILIKGAKGVWTCADEFIKNGFYISDHLPVHTSLMW
tara:strand:- start:56 stop:871 length:816 start_codon:yes stop_codon:yes gene_type:complete